MRRTLLLSLLLVACVSVPEQPAPGTSQAYGRIRLVPREGVTPGSAGSASYGDRRLRDVEFVDYTRPGFAVVYVASGETPDGEIALAIRESRMGTTIEPALAAVGAAGRIAIRNDGTQSYVISYPAAGVVRPLAPGESAEFAVPRAGEQGLFVLDAPDAGATVFAAPGRFGIATPAGRFRVNDVTPGTHELRVWHPRFPPVLRRVELAPNASVEVDFELGVGRTDGEHAHH